MAGFGRIWPDKMTKDLITVIQQNWGGGSSFSFSELKALVDTPERSLRRYLKQAVDKGKLIQEGAGRGTKYKVVADSPVEGSPSVSDRADHPYFSKASQPSLRILDQPIHQRSPVSYQIERLEDYTPNETRYVPQSVSKKLKALGRRESLDNKASTYIKKILDRLLVDLSYNSSRLEGNTYTISETTKLINEGVEADNKATAESTMILNHKEAIRKATELASIKSTPDLWDILTLHFLLSDQLVNPDDSGAIRQDAVGITQTTYSPIEGTERLEEYLVLLLRKANEISDVIERSVFLLLNIAYLQPFIDVNKRTSRLACIIPLLHVKMVPQTFLDIESDDYAKAMIAFYELGDVTPAVELYAWSYERSCSHYDAQVIAVGFDEVKASHRPMRREFIRMAILENLSSEHYVERVKEFAKGKITEEELDQFIKDTRDELGRLSIVRISGMGITTEEFEKWAGQGGNGFLKYSVLP